MFVNTTGNFNQPRRKKTIIAISGKRGTGKTLYGNLWKSMHGSGVRVFAFADVLKEYVRLWFNLTKEHTDGALKEKPTKYINYGVKPIHGVSSYWTPRDMMIKVGQFFRQFDPLFWVTKIVERIKPLPDNSVVIITDLRFKNEARAVKEAGGIILRLERDPKLTPYEGEINDPSEIEMDDYDGFDYIVPAEKNRNPQDAQKNIAKIMKEIQGNGLKVI